MAETTPYETPKRKRGTEAFITPIRFSFDPNRPAEEEGNSPRSKVAHKFRGLVLENEDPSGGGVVDATNNADYDGIKGGQSSDEDGQRKRQRSDEDMPDVAAQDASESNHDSDSSAMKEKPAAKNPLSQSLQRAFSSISRLSESKSRAIKKRLGTPPRGQKKKAAESSDETSEDNEVEIVDPVRAALTWQENEITIYDPNDADDDGTGINGVGFRPTPAMAHARLMKRRQQMAEYRKREESEARARRNQRRRGRDQLASSSQEEEPPSRKVRFMEGKASAFITT